MRIVVAVVAALSLLLAIAGDADAGTHAKTPKRHAKKPAAQHSYSARSYKPDAYVERDANRLPFGSSIWWEQMQREGRLGEDQR